MRYSYIPHIRRVQYLLGEILIVYPGLFMKRMDCRTNWALFEMDMNNTG